MRREISITKTKGKYLIYLPYVGGDSDSGECEWWGLFDTFDDCYKKAYQKSLEYPHLYLDPNCLRKLKIKKIKKRWVNVGGLGIKE